MIHLPDIQTYRKLKSIPMGLKTLRICLVIVYALLNLNKEAQAQCPNGSPPKTITQNTTTGINGDHESFPFDQFDPSLGTLIGVDIHANITGLIAMTVINYNTAPKSYNVAVYRKDTLKSPGLGVQLVVDTTVNYATVTLPGSVHPGTPPTYFDRYPNSPAEGLNYESRYVSAPVNKDVYQTITNPAILAAYLGGGSVNIDYVLDPGFSLSGGASQAVGLITTYATNMDLTVTYTYCTNSVLPSGKLDFFASKKSDNNVDLSWTKEHEENNINYAVEMSTNGVDFTSVGAMQSQKPASDGTVVKYEFGYTIPVSAAGKVYFRVKQTEASGKIQYSAIRTIDISNKQQLTLNVFPNPADREINLQFDTPQKNNMQADLINSIGQTIESNRIIANGSRQYALMLRNKYPAGVYFLRVSNINSKEQNITRLIIR